MKIAKKNGRDKARPSRENGRDEARPSQVTVIDSNTPTLKHSNTVSGSVTPEVVGSAYEIEECNSTDAAERVRFHLSKAHVAANVAMKHIIEAGRELAIQKQLLGHGQWIDWCATKLEISYKTAERYIDTFQRTIGVKRIEQGVSLDAKLLKKELDAATVGMEEKTVRQAMLELGVIKRPSGWGGGREGAGRKSKAKDEAEEVSAQLDAVVNSPALLIASIREPLATVYKSWRERDVFARIDLKDLGQVAATLKELANAANDALKARSKE